MQFNSIAKYYYFISKMAFGNSLEVAKTSLFREIPANAKVLMIGGGAGYSLKHLLGINSCAKIDFVESSIEMIELAKLKIEDQNRVSFICEPIEEFEGVEYDVIITEFFLDLFKKEKIENLVPAITLKLNPKGYWIDTDFKKTDKVFHKILLSTMYLFFKITAKIEAGCLDETSSIFKLNGFELVNKKTFKSGFIASCLFVRP